jgi:hypothetical protein
LGLPQQFPRLVLHFDINKTIIMSDPVSNIGVDKMLNSLLSECTWGVPTQSQSLPHSQSLSLSQPQTGVHQTQGQGDDELWHPEDWKLCSSEPSDVSPVPSAVTYGEFLENYCTKTVTRDQRKALKTAFTAQGGAGEHCVGTLQRLREAMTIPAEVCVDNEKYISDSGSGGGSGGVGGAEGKPLSEVLDLLQSRQYHIVPSFLRLISHLDRNNVDFRIIFRTFGVDVARVAAEFNMFCEGRHPVFNRLDSVVSDGIGVDIDPVTGERRVRKMDGSAGTTDRRLRLPDHSGRLLRTAGQDESRSVHFAHVTAEKVGKESHIVSTTDINRSYMT